MRRAGLGVDASLRAFALGFDAAAQAPAQPAPIDLSRPVPAAPEQAASARTQPLLDMIRRDFPACAQPMLTAGVRRQLEFQDLAYAREYLERMKALRDLDARTAARRGNGN